jgi:hypothetical protein
MSREIIVKFTFDWDGYEGVDDELLIEDLGFRIEDGVTWEILKNDHPYWCTPEIFEEARRIYSLRKIDGVKYLYEYAKKAGIENALKTSSEILKKEEQK